MAAINFGEDLIRVHKMMTRGLHVSAERSDAYSRGGYPSPKLAEGFDRYVRALVSVLHVHHHGEDKLGWPFLRKYMPEAPYEQLIAQHAAMVEVLDRAEAARRANNLLALHTHLDACKNLWLEHVEIEERAFSIKATAAAMPPETHAKLVRRFQRHAQLHARPIPQVVAFTLYNLSPEDRAAMEETIPALITDVLMPTIWKRAWAPMKPFLILE
jgi:hypothetical protein